MSEERIIEQFKLLKRAKKLEEMGNNERALALYKTLHEEYQPNTSDAYERPAILLERSKKYEEALSLCLKAIEQIELDNMSGTKEKFEKRIENLKEKMLVDDDYSPPEEKTKYAIGIIGFRSKNKIKMITAFIFYIIFIVSGILFKSSFATLTLIGFVFLTTYFVDFLQSKSSKLIILTLFVFSMTITVYSGFQLPAAYNKIIELKDHDALLEGGENIFKVDEDLPVISDENIKKTREIIESEVEVIESVIIVNENSVTFGLKLQPGTNKEKAIRLSEDFIETLAHLVSKDESIKPPGFNSLGELYDYYSILVSAGSDETTILAKGQKSKDQKFITWRD